MFSFLPSEILPPTHTVKHLPVQSNNRNTTKTSGVFTVKFEHFADLFLVFLLFILCKYLFTEKHQMAS